MARHYKAGNNLNHKEHDLFKKKKYIYFGWPKGCLNVTKFTTYYGKNIYIQKIILQKGGVPPPNSQNAVKNFYE